MLLRQFNTVEVRAKNDRVRECVISSSRADMHNTIIPVENWDLDFFNKAGAVYYQHKTDTWEANPDYCIGKGEAVRDGSDLIGSTDFEPETINPFAEKILKKVDFGTINCTSVGFQPLEGGQFGDETRGEDPRVYYFGKVRLLEFSWVHIPSNLDAIKREYVEFLSKEIPTNKMSVGLVRDINTRLKSMLK
jgi:hypothetical protein